MKVIFYYKESVQVRTEQVKKYFSPTVFISVNGKIFPLYK